MTEYSIEQWRLLLGLLRIPGVGPVKFAEILAKVEDLSCLFDAHDQCTIMPGVADWRAVDQDLQWAEQPHCHLISQQNILYPRLLREISNAPPVLFVHGNIDLLERPQIAMVGSRNPTTAGMETALQFAEHFSKAGFTITSGLAIGIDGAAHRGALLGTGSTIAVVAHGLDSVYPAQHRDLAQRIMGTGGALVSEFPIGVGALAGHFPRRNRIISGLSVGTLVVEAALNSGSLITAKQALDQGREVFAIPGSIHSPLAKGCHGLIRQGAKLVETTQDVLEELGALMRYVIRQESTGTDVSEIRPTLAPSYAALLREVGFECTPLDLVVLRSGLTAQKVSSMLLELELQGQVVSVPGGYARALT
jgi:DNA processing protein